MIKEVRPATSPQKVSNSTFFLSPLRIPYLDSTHFSTTFPSSNYELPTMIQFALPSLSFATRWGIALVAVGYRLQQIYTLYFRVPASPLQNYKRNGSLKSNGEKNESSVAWALITGSSAGIGFGYAQYLLSRGFGVIILSHEGVQEAEEALLKEYPNGHVRSITMDCLTASPSDIENLVKSISDLNVTILINNVGSIPMDYPPFRLFRDYDSQGIENNWHLNAGFATHLTQQMIPILEKNAQPRSLILNIASQAHIGLPYLTGYSSAKGYLISFSASLAREFRLFNTPIDCLAITPGDVHSQGNRYGVTPGAPQAGEYAKIVLERVDGAVERGLFEFSPYWKHALQSFMLGLLPERVVAREVLKVVAAKKDALAEEHRSR